MKTPNLFPKIRIWIRAAIAFRIGSRFEGCLQYIRHDYESLTFIPSGDSWLLKALLTAKCLENLGQTAKLQAGVSATCSSFEMAEFRACTSISIPTIREKTKHGLDGAGIATGDVLLRSVNLRFWPVSIFDHLELESTAVILEQSNLSKPFLVKMTT